MRSPNVFSARDESPLRELKAVDKLLPLHLAQVLTYLKLSGHRVALLIKFNVPHLRDGIRRVMNGLERGEDPDPTK